MVATLAVFPGPSQAADVLAPVTVTATRLEVPRERVPAAVSVVGIGAVQQARQQLALDEALATVPGVLAQNRYNFAQDTRLSIRGFGARATFGLRGLRLLVDGIPATLPDGQSEVDALDLGVVERIEVLRGPAASLYGSSAGGVVRVTTERGGGPPWGEVRVASGSYGYRQVQAKGGGEAGPVELFAGLNHQRLEGYREHAASERTVLSGRAGVALGAGELEALVSVVDAPEAQDPGALSAEQVDADRRAAGPLNLRFDTGERVRQQRLGLVYSGPGGASGAVRLRAHGVVREFANRLPFSAVELEREVWGGGAEYERSGDRWRLLVGAEFQTQDDRRVRRGNLDGTLGAVFADQRERAGEAGVFAHLERDLAPAWRIDLGLRHDAVTVDVDDRFLADGDDSGERRFREWSPSAALLWQATPAVSAYLRAATGFETPTTTELADPAGGGGFNGALEPERIRSLEAGARGRWGDASWEAALYRTWADDLLVPVPIPGAPDRFAFRNAGQARLDGLELALDLPLSPRLDLRAAYTWNDYRYHRYRDAAGNSFAGNRLPGQPRHQLGLALTYRDPGGLTAVWETRYLGRLYADDANDVDVPDHAVSDLRLTWEPRDAVALFAGVNNLFATDYNANIRINGGGERYFEPAPGRHLYGGVSVALD